MDGEKDKDEEYMVVSRYHCASRHDYAVIAYIFTNYCGEVTAIVLLFEYIKASPRVLESKLIQVAIYSSRNLLKPKQVPPLNCSVN